MNSTFAFSFLVVIFCVIPFGSAIQCYACTDAVSCQNASLIECNSVHATQTFNFLYNYFQNVSTEISTSFDCVQVGLNTSTTSVYYKGCTYYNVNSCGYTLFKNFTASNTSVECFQCNNYDGCNAADRSYASVAALMLSLLFIIKLVVE